MDALRKYVELGEALKSKYDEIKTGVIVRENMLQEQYKPLLEPLRNIGETLRPLPNSTEKLIGPLATKYLAYSASKNVKTDKTFGLRMEGHKLMIGNMKVVLDNDNLILDNDARYVGTPGLWELLTLATPKNYSNDDLDAYHHIIYDSNALYHNNDPSSQRIKASSSYKYKNIIKPFLQMIKQQNEERKRRQGQLEELHTSLNEELSPTDLAMVDPQYKQGEGLSKILTKTPVEYKRWNTLDELLEQLYIDIGEIKAGNNNPSIRNDIIDILREIREEK